MKWDKDGDFFTDLLSCQCNAKLPPASLVTVAIASWLVFKVYSFLTIPLHVHSWLVLGPQVEESPPPRSYIITLLTILL